MTRIFTVIALFALVVTLATAGLGLSLDLHHHLDDPADSPVKGWARVHRLSGLAAGVCVVFAHSIVVTYFVGTSRWCKEVCETYRLAPEFVERSNRLKRRTFPWAVSGMLAVVGIVALGGAADPATLRSGTADWVNIHLLGALGGIAFIAYSFFVEWHNIVANHAIIDEIVAAVRDIRGGRDEQQN